LTVLSVRKIKVLCVDGSVKIRTLLCEIINDQPDMEVVAVASDPIMARELIKQHDPDVLTLDSEMPRMDGLDFLGRLMRLRPMPVVMISSKTQPGSEKTQLAMALGARDVIAKPRIGVRAGLLAKSAEITNKIRTAAASRPFLLQLRPISALIRLPKSFHPIKPSIPVSGELLLIGASTGGVEAIRKLLEQLPATTSPVLIVEHMPVGFTRSFAERLNRTCQLEVTEAIDGERLLSGHAYIAPGDQHLKLDRNGSEYVARLDAGPEVNRHRPSVDVLFYSAARHAGRNATGVLLTGMGKDGAAGLLAMRDAGALTIAQDEASSLIFGMPREAIALGAAREVISLDAIAGRLTASPNIQVQTSQSLRPLIASHEDHGEGA
jgi:two-component system chemotaxis response regulator CheB